MLSVVVEKHLQPAWTGGDELSGIAGSPSFSKTDANTEGVPGSLLALRFHAMLRHPTGAFIVKHLEGETRHHPLHTQSSSTGWVQSGRVDKHRVLAAIIHPHSIRLSAQHDAVANFTANLLHTAAAAAAAIPSASVAVMLVKTRCAVAARVFPAAVVGVGVELAQAESRALR